VVKKLGTLSLDDRLVAVFDGAGLEIADVTGFSVGDTFVIEIPGKVWRVVAGETGPIVTVVPWKTSQSNLELEGQGLG
jgi:hypothetical protein